MSNITRTSTLIIRAQEQGVAETARKLEQLNASATVAARGVEGFAKTTETSARGLGTIEREIDSLQKRLVGSPAAWASFEKGQRTASRALDQGKLTVEEYGRTVLQLQQRLQQAIAPRLGLDVDQSGIAQALQGQKAVSVATRESVRDLLQQAEVQQRVTAEAARANDLMASEVARLRAEIDPLAAAQARLNAEMAQYDGYARQGMISTDELARAQALANDRFTVAAARAGAVGQQVKLTSGQVTNLGYQVNDVGTMLAMGMSPFAILASQGGQVAQALGDGPGGVLNRTGFPGG